MKIAAGILGIIAGLMSLTYVGLYGGLVGGAASWFGSFGPQGNDVSSWADTVKFLSWSAPILVLFGGGLCFTKPGFGGLILGAGAFAHWYLLGFGSIGNLFIIPPAIAALLAFAAAGGELERRAVERADAASPPSRAAPICSSCGKHNSADARFCAGCGSAFVRSEEALAPALAAQAAAPNAPPLASSALTAEKGFAGLQEQFAELSLAAKLAIGAAVIVVVGVGIAMVAHKPSVPSSVPQLAVPTPVSTNVGAGTGFIGTQSFGAWTLQCDPGAPVIKDDTFGRCRVNLIYRRKDDAKQVVMVIALRLLGPQQHLAVIVVLPRIVKKGDTLNLQAGSKSLKIPVSACKPGGSCAALVALGSNGEAELLTARSVTLFFPPDASGKRSGVGVPFTGLSAAVETMRRAEQPAAAPIAASIDSDAAQSAQVLTKLNQGTPSWATATLRQGAVQVVRFTCTGCRGSHFALLHNGKGGFIGLLPNHGAEDLLARWQQTGAANSGHPNALLTDSGDGYAGAHKMPNGTTRFTFVSSVSDCEACAPFAEFEYAYDIDLGFNTVTPRPLGFVARSTLRHVVWGGGSGQ